MQRIAKLIKYGSRAGWEFTVLTANEKGNIPSDTSLLNDIPQNTRVVRIDSGIPVPKKSANSNLFRRWLSAALFIPDIRKKWLPRISAALREELKNNSYHCVLISIPPYSLATLAAELTDSVEIPVILDMRDPWTQNPYKLHPTPFHHQADWKIEQNAIRRVRWGISAYQSVIDFYSKKIPGFNPECWLCVPNGFDEEDFASLRPELFNDGNFHLGFSGTFYSHINHPDFLFRAMAELKKQNPDLASRLVFHHLGTSHINLLGVARKYGLEKQVRAEGYLPHKETLQKLTAMDVVCFILDDTDPRSMNTVGGKVYEYLRLGKPILALVPEIGEAADLIRRTKSGAVISPSKTKEISEQLQQWLTRHPQMTFAGINEYSRSSQAQRMIRFLERVVNEG